LASNLNFGVGQTIPNVVITRASGGRVSLFNSAGSAHLVVDVAGWLPWPAPPVIPWHCTVLDGEEISVDYDLNPLIAPRAAVFGGAAHVFYANNNSSQLLHAYESGSTWAREPVDGGSDPSAPRLVGFVKAVSAVLAVPGALHLFYILNVGYDVYYLRHAVFDGSLWTYETIDGDASATDHVSGDPSWHVGALVDGSELHVWYSAGGASSHRVLRHAVSTQGVWSYEDIDGLGGDAGRTSASYTAYVRAAKDSVGLVHVFGQVNEGANKYSIHHGSWDGAEWQFETLDGVGSSGTGGRTVASVSGPIEIGLDSGGSLNVVYQLDDDSTPGLRRALLSGGAPQFDMLDDTAKRAYPGAVLQTNVGLEVWYTAEGPAGGGQIRRFVVGISEVGTMIDGDGVVGVPHAQFTMAAPTAIAPGGVPRAYYLAKFGSLSNVDLCQLEFTPS
jgi:hypothetical protein